MTGLTFRTPVKRRSPFDSFVNDFFEGEFKAPQTSTVSKPSANVFELKDAFRIELMVPGFSKENFKIEVNGDLLKIKTELEKTESEDKVLRNEFVVNNIERLFKLTEDIDSAQISADYKNGILVLTLKKQEIDKSDKRRLIEIK